MSTELALPLIDARAVRQSLQRRVWRRDPALWAQERVGNCLWSKQREIMEAVQQHRKVAVRSCHGPGKSFTAAQIAGWWLDVWPPGDAVVITTAPTDNQVKVVLWKEIRRVHRKGKLRGRTNQKQWFMFVPPGIEELVAQGRKPADYDPAAFQGIHAGRVLVIFDEACGIPGVSVETPNSLWEGAEALLTSDDCRFLAIGNPDDPTSHFATICKPGSGWHVIGISVFETPNFTGEALPEYILRSLVGRTWVEERRIEWMPGWHWNDEGTNVLPPAGVKLEDAHPLWLSKVLGVFPDNKRDQGLIPWGWIEAAQQRTLEAVGDNELGVDVGAGGDASCTAHRHGPVIRILGEDHNPDTMQTCGKVISERRLTGATKVKVDEIGIGRGVVDRGIEQGEPFLGVNVGEGPTCSDLADCIPQRDVHDVRCNKLRFLNLRAQLYWELRERFERGNVDLDPNDRATAAELASLRFKRTSAGKIQIESKDEAKRRGVPSPNRAEAVMLATAVLPERDAMEGRLVL